MDVLDSPVKQQQAIRMFEVFARLQQEYAGADKTPQDEAVRVAQQTLEGYFRSHPIPAERIAQIQKLIASENWGVRAERDDEEPAAIFAEAIGFPGDGGLSRLRHGQSGHRGDAERGAARREDHPSLHVGSPSLLMLGGRHDAVVAIGHGASRI